MTEETGLQALGNAISEVESKFDNEKALSIVTKVGDYLPYIGLYGSNSDEVKRGNFPMGHFGLKQGKQIIDLGEEVPLLFLAWRSKAMNFAELESFYDVEDPAFEDLMHRANTEQNSGCGFGPEFLVWCWTAETPTFATYFMSSKTARNEAPNLLGPLKQGPCYKIQKAHLIETKKYTWHGPLTKAYEMEATVMPEQDKMLEIVNKFKNPPKSEKELVDNDKDETER